MYIIKLKQNNNVYYLGGIKYDKYGNQLSIVNSITSSILMAYRFRSMHDAVNKLMRFKEAECIGEVIEVRDVC